MIMLDAAQEARILTLAEQVGTSNTLTVKNEDEQLIKIAIRNAEEAVAISQKMIPRPAYLGAQIAHLKRLQVVISPHKKIPPEVWLKIMCLLVDEGGPGYFCVSPGFLGSSSTRKYTPWTLRHVCSPWRSLVLSHTPFWNKIAVDPLPDEPGEIRPDSLSEEAREAQEQANMRRKVQTWESIIAKLRGVLPPSGPISIGILGLPCWDESNTGRRASLVENSLLSTHVGVSFLHEVGTRLVNLNVRYCANTELERLVTIPSSTFSSLEKVSIDFASSRSAPDHRSIVRQSVPMLRASPQLRSVSIEGGGSDIEIILSAPLAWNQFTRLQLSQWKDPRFPIFFLSTTRVLQVLTQAQTLSDLSISFELTTIPAGTQVLTLSTIRSLSISSGNMYLLDHLSLPSLRALNLTRSPKEEDIYQVVRIILEFVRRSGCTLTSFTEAPKKSKFHGLPFSQHRPEFEGLLTDVLRHARKVELNGILFGVNELQRVGCSEIFPEAYDIAFSCEVPSRKALELIESRIMTKNLSCPLERIRLKSEVGSASNKQAQEYEDHYWKNHNVKVDVFYDGKKKFS